jgi:hypothetical protein
MKRQFRPRAPWLATLALALLVAPAFAQVPQDMTYTGRLVDGGGAPLAGPVDLELRVFDADTGPTQLYSEQHEGVLLDEAGGFSVQLGLGTSPSGTFDAALFSDVNRWLEVVVGTDVLTPRQIIASVPWALIAQQANEIVPNPNAPFKNCGDGTVADPQTGLLWEKKTGTVASPGVFCETAGCPDPNDVNNLYEWSNSGSAPDGGAFTDFLAKLNDPVFGAAATQSDVTGCFAGHCDWRLPNIVELQTILDTPCPAEVNFYCIDPIFGPSQSSAYWSASSNDLLPGDAWFALFFEGVVGFSGKGTDWHARAVRVGSCH